MLKFGSVVTLNYPMKLVDPFHCRFREASTEYDMCNLAGRDADVPP